MDLFADRYASLRSPILGCLRGAVLALVVGVGAVPSLANEDDAVAQADEEVPTDIDLTRSAPSRVGSPESAVIERRRVYGTPLRLDTRASLRGGTVPGVVMELASQVVDVKRTTLDLGFAFAWPRGLGLVGPWRTMASADFNVNVMYAANNWIAFGPTAGVSYRLFRQQWAPISELWIPIAGARVSSTIVGARTWKFSLDFKGTADLVPIRLVNETAEVVRLEPLELQIGIRFHIGRALRRL